MRGEHVVRSIIAKLGTRTRHPRAVGGVLLAALLSAPALGLLVALLFFAPPATPASAATVNIVAGSIAVDTTWTADNVYVVQGDVTVAQGFRLTIQPGTIVKFKTYANLVIAGTLDARGVADNQIIFTSFLDDSAGGDTNGDGPATVPAKLDWAWIEFSDTSDDSQSFIQYSILRYGGRDLYCDGLGRCRDIYGGMIRLSNAAPTLSNLTFEQNYINGIEIPGGTKSASATVTGETWQNTSIPYVVTGNLVIGQGFTLTITPGIIVKFATYSRLYVDGALDARGTAADPITFTSLRDDTSGGDTNADGLATTPAALDWAWIEFRDSSNDSGSFIQHGIMRYGGRDLHCDGLGRCGDIYGGMITLSNAAPTLSNLTFEQNYINGVEIPGGTKTASATVTGETWANTDVVYVLTGDLVIGQGFTLTITPGLTIKLTTYSRLYVDGALDARGTAADPITFTSFRDDTISGDTNADGPATTPAKNDWAWIDFRDTSDDGKSFIQHSNIRYGGRDLYCDGLGRCGDDYGGMIRLSNATPTLSNLTFEQNYINGVEIPGGTKSASATVTGETWANTDVVYVLTGNVVAAQGFTLTIAPGMVVKFGSGAGITVQGTLDARGTADQPITFTSFQDDEYGGDTDADGANTPPKVGDWGIIHFADTSDDQNTIVDHALIRYGGGVQIFGAGPQIARSRITLNQRGFEIRNSATPLLTENDIHSNADQGVFVSNSQPIIRRNNIYDNGTFGVYNETATICVNAQNNWWGSDTGPADASDKTDSCTLGKHAGLGGKVTDNVDYDPWLGTPPMPLGDLFIGELDVWIDPATIYTGDLVGIGVNVRSSSDHTISNVDVSFYDGNPSSGGKLIGDPVYTIPLIAPWGVESQWTTKVWDTTGLVGVHSIYVVVDPKNTISEGNERNNVVVRRVEIKGGTASNTDTSPPSGTLIVNAGSPFTAASQVTLSLSATDNTGGTGVAKMYISELEFNQSARQWVSIQQSGWVTYTASLPWTLSQGGGLHYLQAWFADTAGNISLQPARASINFAPPNDPVALGAARLYRFTLSAGQRVTLTVTPSAGDADLYVWMPGSVGRPDYYSNQVDSATDSITFTATKTGVFQVAVVGYTAAQYTLSFVSAAPANISPEPNPAHLAATTKIVPLTPPTLLDPPAQSGVPVASTSSQSTVFLPMVRR
jgi:parallel beta-helix repeat protein